MEPYKVLSVDVERDSSAVDSFAVSLTATVQVNFDRELTKFEEHRIGVNFDKMAESTEVLQALGFARKKLRFEARGDAAAEDFVRQVALKAEEYAGSANASLKSARDQLEDLQSRLSAFVTE